MLGFAIVEIKQYDAHLDTISTRSFMDKSYKGIGTTLVNTIIRYFNNESSNLIALSVHARPEALDFYLKVGFKRTGKMSRDLYIPFDNYDKYIETEDIYKRNYQYMVAREIGDKEMIHKIECTI